MAWRECQDEIKYVLIMAKEKDILVKEGECVGSLASMVEVDGQQDSDTEEELDLSSLISLDNLSTAQQTAVFKLLENYREVLSRGDHDIGFTNVTEHRINLTNETPIFQRPRRFPPPVAEELERQCQQLSSLDVIEPSVSAWSSPIVPVR